MKKIVVMLIIFISMFTMIGCSTDGIKGIEITQNPTKLTVDLGDELNLSGLIVKVVMKDGNKLTLEPEQYQISGYDKTKEGNQTITISYGKHKTSLSINVVNYQGPIFNKVTIAYGNELLDVQTLFGVNAKSQKLSNSNKENMISTVETEQKVVNNRVITYIGSVEYFILEIDQPENVADYYIIDSVTIRGSNWTNDIKYIRGSGFQDNELKQRHEDGVTKVYIRLGEINEEHREELDYEVISVQYIDGESIKDVRYSDTAVKSVMLMAISQNRISTDRVTFSNSISGNNISFKVSNPDGITVDKILLNQQVIFEGDHPYKNMDGDVTLTIPELDLSDNDNWARISLIYDVLDDDDGKTELLVTGYETSVRYDVITNYQDYKYPSKSLQESVIQPANSSRSYIRISNQEQFSMLNGLLFNIINSNPENENFLGLEIMNDIYIDDYILPVSTNIMNLRMAMFRHDVSNTSIGNIIIDTTVPIALVSCAEGYNCGILQFYIVGIQLTSELEGRVFELKDMSFGHLEYYLYSFNQKDEYYVLFSHFMFELVEITENSWEWQQQITPIKIKFS